MCVGGGNLAEGGWFPSCKQKTFPRAPMTLPGERRASNPYIIPLLPYYVPIMLFLYLHLYPDLDSYSLPLESLSLPPAFLFVGLRTGRQCCLFMNLRWNVGYTVSLRLLITQPQENLKVPPQRVKEILDISSLQEFCNFIFIYLVREFPTMLCLGIGVKWNINPKWVIMK